MSKRPDRTGTWTFDEPLRLGDLVVLPVVRRRADAADAVPEALGVFAVRGDAVSWQPAFDLTRVVLRGQLLALALALALLAVAWFAARRPRP